MSNDGTTLLQDSRCTVLGDLLLVSGIVGSGSTRGLVVNRSDHSCEPLKVCRVTRSVVVYFVFSIRHLDVLAFFSI